MKNFKYKKQLAIAACLLVLVSLLAYYVINFVGIKSEVVVELGSKSVNTSLFLKNPSDTCTLKTALTKEELNTIGSYPVVVVVGDKEYDATVKVEDTTAPMASLQTAEAWINESIDPTAFISIMSDRQAVKVSFMTEPDYSVEGEQQVNILLEDESLNQRILTATLVVKKDTEAPVIEGAQDKTVYIGNTVSYRDGVTVTDNKDESVTLNIDNSKVNLKKEGTYEVVYLATDAAGNKAEKTIEVTVKEKPSNYVDEATVNALADDVLSRIINDGMSQKEKLRAIYNYVRNNVGYRDGHDKPGWVIAAYNGLKRKSGDCYVFWATSKVLLTRAGIDNVDIKKHDISISGHYWNLVNIGEGWYHFDTTPRAGGFDGFYLSDATLTAYSEAHQRSHNYDASLYPTIQ